MSGDHARISQEEINEALQDYLSAEEALESTPEFAEFKKDLGIEVGFDTLKDLAKEGAKEATAGMTTNALVAGNPLKMTPQGAVATTLPMLHSMGAGDPRVEAYKQIPAPPNLSLEPVLPVQIPLGDMAKGINNAFFQTGMGAKNMIQDAGNAFMGMLKAQPGQYPEGLGVTTADSQSTKNLFAPARTGPPIPIDQLIQKGPARPYTPPAGPGPHLNPEQTMEFRDANGNGIEDRGEGIYLERDYLPAGQSSPVPQNILNALNAR